MRRQHLVAFAGVGVAAMAVAAGMRSVLSHQAAIARRRIGKPLGEHSLDSDRLWRPSLGGDPIELLVLGDSLAAGLGAERRKQTLGGRLAKGLARRLGRPVHLRTAAIVGSESPDLPAQLTDLPEDYAPHVAVIVVGGNDVTHRIAVAVSTQHLRDAILCLRRRGTEVVVGTCPDLGALRPVPQPLRRLVSSMSRRLAEAQTETALAAGAHPVDLRRAVGPMFFDDPDAMFSMDRFHPSPLGYRRTAEALLPTVCLAAEAALSSRLQAQR
ncbi:lysophospholipase L1-like esterase [Microbacterium phyllosphaerae]|uniref:Lysophospholipase L1-like esterase n=1 Tax=Microbacterium phyllosphaerae TaxID=124798 RepID=A0ABS4WPJ7_9MICO|nr:SGNH/GDSL hydrolase family protein [Microbacterium phyllosphaerae]MBP2378126.1 lysophospholipase L1-like esterase [Microbacterium phyllosphaerae]